MQEQNVFLIENNIVGMDDEKPQKVERIARRRHWNTSERGQDAMVWCIMVP